MRGAGRVVFVAFMLLMLGTINVIYGIGALDGANYFVNDTRFILNDLNTLGWVLIVLGVIQLTGGFSLMAGQHLRPCDRRRRRHPRRDRGTVLDGRRQPVVVALRVPPLHLRRPWDRGLRRGKAGGRDSVTGQWRSAIGIRSIVPAPGPSRPKGESE